MKIKLTKVSWGQFENRREKYINLSPKADKSRLKLWFVFNQYIISDIPPYEGVVPVKEKLYKIK